MAPQKRLLLVDDDATLRETLAEQLSLEGFEVREAGTGAACLAALESEIFDLIILDVGLPDADGRDICRNLRAKGKRMPVIMLTGVDSEDDTVQGLDSGANDYVTKPFRFNELMARIRAQLRSFEQSEDAVFKIGPYAFRPSTKTLVREDSSKVRLTEKETAILKYLYRSGDQVVSRDTLLHEVWGYNTGVTTHTLETHVYRLRQKIENDPSNAALLITESGGYKLMA